MEITVTSRHMAISDAVRDYAEEKIGEALKIFERETIAAQVILRREKNPSIANPAICEVTVEVVGNLIRAQEEGEDLFAAIDLAAARIARQMRKYKTRVIDKKIHASERLADFIREDARPETDLDLDRLMEELSADDEIVRVKEIEFKPMTEEEALIQIDLLGHDFFVYTDRDTNVVCVLYRRGNGGYGVLKQKD